MNKRGDVKCTEPAKQWTVTGVQLLPFNEFNFGFLFFLQITSEENETSTRCRWWISPPLVTTNLGCCRVTWPQRRPGDGPPPSGPSALSHTAGTSPGRFRPAGPEEEGRGCGCAPSCPVSLSSLWMCLYLTGQKNWEAKGNWVTYSFYW